MFVPVSIQELVSSGVDEHNVQSHQQPLTTFSWNLLQDEKANKRQSSALTAKLCGEMLLLLLQWLLLQYTYTTSYKYYACKLSQNAALQL